MSYHDRDFWNSRWEKGETQWDIGYASPALVEFTENNIPKDARILIPGCGNAYEAEYLHRAGYTNLYIADLSPLPFENLLQRYPKFPENHCLTVNFFEISDSFDLVLEQTFFCALHPTERSSYVEQMYKILKPGGCLAGLLFNAEMNTDRPPYGGNETEYRKLFSNYFEIRRMEPCMNSIPPRADKEVFIELYRL
jgi:SAM-dependent methyltransferase